MPTTDTDPLLLALQQHAALVERPNASQCLFDTHRCAFAIRIATLMPHAASKLFRLPGATSNGDMNSSDPPVCPIPTSEERGGEVASITRCIQETP